MEKYNYEQWKKMSTELTKTKQNIEEMSKLYIIAHTRVKTILRKVQTDLTYDPTDDCKGALQFVKQILQRLANRHNDEYLCKIDPSVLDKYQQNYFGLMQLLRLALVTQSSKNKVDVQQLFGVKQKKKRNDEFSLKGQLRKSEQRMVRTKSGHRITRQKNNKVKQDDDDNSYEQLIAEKDVIINQSALHTQSFLQKRQHLEQTINEHIEKQGYSVNFKKKYCKLDQYLEQRKEFADLLFCQKYYDKMIEEGKTRKNQAKVVYKKDPDMVKIFPEFNIKTKYMKKQVKENVLKVIFDVKKQLLHEYHMSNVAKMQQGNDNGMMKLAQKRKSEPKPRLIKSQTSSTTTLPERFKSTNRIKNEFFRQTNKSLGNTRRMSNPSTKKLAWDLPLSDQAQLKLNNIVKQSKMPLYGK